MPSRKPPAPTRRRVLKTGSAAVLGISLMPWQRSFAAEDKKLNFLNWDTYIGENTLDEFKDATGIRVRMDLFADNDELFAKFKAGNPGYDVIMPTNDYVERMVLADMLMPLNHDKIPNISNITESFMTKADFDPGRKFSLPYLWGTIGIGYRKSKTKTPIDSWKSLLDSDEHAGRIALLGTSQYVLGIALKYLGYSWNSQDPAEIKAAEKLIIDGKKRFKVFADDNGQDLLIAGEVDVAQEWNGDILQVMSEDDDLTYVIPKEGSNIWQDTIAIAKGAPHPENAHAFINHIFDAKVGADIAKTVQYATPNAAAKKLMDAEYLNSPAIFPPDELLANCEPSLYLGEDATRLRDEAWSRIQAA